MKHKNVKGKESPVIPGADDAAASCAIFTTSAVWKPHVLQSPSIQTHTEHWPYSQSWGRQSWNRLSSRNPASDKFGSEGKWRSVSHLKIEKKWGSFTVSGLIFEQKATTVSRAWTFSQAKPCSNSICIAYKPGILDSNFSEPYFLTYKNEDSVISSVRLWRLAAWPMSTYLLSTYYTLQTKSVRC